MENTPRSSPADAPAARLQSLVKGFWTTQALYVATTLGIPDLLADGPRSSDALANSVGAHPPSLHRLLRALTTIEVVQERSDGMFALLPMGDLLRSDSPTSLRSWTLFIGEYQWQVWGDLLGSVRTGQSARERLFGTKEFEHLERNPELAALFNQAMVELTRLVSAAVVEAYDFTGMKRIMDVGGGYGELLRAILTAHPTAQGILFDMAHAIEQGRGYLETVGVASRCEFVAGDFFASVPSGADAYVLKSIIHDWNDERATAILTACRRAMGPEAKLLLVERVLPERLGTTPADQSLAHTDLNMLVSLAAQERTVADYRKLLEASGLHLNRAIPTQGASTILEAHVA
jgi:orsellinic acid C2-O-methyltransferase